MSNAIGNTKDLGAGRTEALQGLVNSLGRDTGNNPSSKTALSTEQLQKLSQKISQILGDGADRGLTPGDRPSQLLNEEGLPIIDISEPIDETFQTNTSHPLGSEQDLFQFAQLPLDERERRRHERDRILNLLEEEERLERLREERDAEEERKEAVKNRKELAKGELEQLNAARNLQKRMGQALVWNTKEFGENKQEKDSRSQPQTTSSVAKRTVSFADAPAVEAKVEEQQTIAHQLNWGNISRSRLRAQGRIPLVSTIQAQDYPMKMCVVERRPMGIHTSSSCPSHEADSDDESIFSSGNLSPGAENYPSEGENGSSSSSRDLLGDEPVEEGFDYDTAQHHREIVLEYHKRRHAMGLETAKALAENTLDNYEKHETPNGQPPLSCFRADRMATAYDKSCDPFSTSVGQSIIPASRRKSLRNSVKLCKLENDQLLGGDSGESGSEDEGVREVIQMLRTGSIQNVGPDFEPSLMSTISPPQGSDWAQEASPSTRALNYSHAIKPSRFKLACGGGHIGTITSQNDVGNKAQPQPAVSNVVVERKTPGSQRFPINKLPLKSPARVSKQAFPLIVDSPAFPMVSSTPTVSLSSPSDRTTGDSPSLGQT